MISESRGKKKQKELYKQSSMKFNKKLANVERARMPSPSFQIAPTQVTQMFKTASAHQHFRNRSVGQTPMLSPDMAQPSYTIDLASGQSRAQRAQTKYNLSRNTN